MYGYSGGDGEPKTRTISLLSADWDTGIGAPGSGPGLGMTIPCHLTFDIGESSSQLGVKLTFSSTPPDRITAPDLSQVQAIEKNLEERARTAPGTTISYDLQVPVNPNVPFGDLDGLVLTVTCAVTNGSTGGPGASSVTGAPTVSTAKTLPFPLSRRSTGWIPDWPDPNDAGLWHPAIGPLLLSVICDQRPLPPRVILPEEVPDAFPPVYDQGDLDTCTANAAASLIRYFEKRAFQRSINPSRLFLYKVARNLALKPILEQGVNPRSVMQALVMVGAPPEAYWPYEAARVNDEPSAFCYALAGDYRSTKYFRYDMGQSEADVLKYVKRGLCHLLPVMFGFYLYPSYQRADRSGEIPFPAPGEPRIAGHCVVAVGYDDDKAITSSDGSVTIGAFRILNSWGVEWGDNGYGWLPYAYLLQGFTADWWSLISEEFINTGRFQRYV